MIFLSAVWWTSIVLAGLSIFLMGGLVVKRIVDQRKMAWRKQRKDALSIRVIEAINGTEPIDYQVRDHDEAELLGEIVYDLSNILKGESKDKIRALVHQAGVEDYYLGDLASKNSTAQLTAINNLTTFTDDRAVQQLWNLLGSAREGNVRLATAFALVGMRADIDFPAIVESMGIGDVVNSSGLRGLFRRMGRRRPESLVDLLLVTENEKVKILCLIGLRDSRDPKLLNHLFSLADEVSDEVRTEAIRTIGLFEHPLGAPQILKALDDRAWQVRAQAAIGVNRIGLSQASPKLVELLVDQQWWVRLRASEALISFGDEGVEMLKSAAGVNPEIAELAKLVIGEAEAESA